LSVIVSYATRPKPPSPKPLTLDDFDLPTAEEDRSIPVVFGTATITGPNVVWSGDFKSQQDTKDGVKRRRYDLGMHFALCYGPVDALTKVMCDEQPIYTTEVTESGQITISQGGLFGGLDAEGGIEGVADVMMGDADQMPNAYLTSKQTGLQPAYRGVLGFVYRGMVSANSPYLKPWSFKVRRIKKGWQRVPASEVPVVEKKFFSEKFGSGLDDYSVSQGNLTPFSIVDNGLNITNTATDSTIEQALPSKMYLKIRFKFKILNGSGSADTGIISFSGDGGSFLTFVARRNSSSDATRKARVITPSNPVGVAVYSSALLVGKWYDIEFSGFNYAADTCYVSLYEHTDELILKTPITGITGLTNFNRIAFQSDSDSLGKTRFDAIECYAYDPDTDPQTDGDGVNENCWYPEKAAIRASSSFGVSGFNVDAFASGSMGAAPFTYWWKLGTDFTGANVAEDNQPSAPGGDVPLTSYVSGFTRVTGIVSGSSDGYACDMNTGAAGSFLGAPVLIDGDSGQYTVGFWIKTPSTLVDSVLFKSNMGGTESAKRGLEIHLGSDGRIALYFGDGAGSALTNYQKYVTSEGAVGPDLTHLIAVTFSTETVGYEFYVYVDGVLETCTFLEGTATTTAWPVASGVTYAAGVAFPKAAVILDEPFIYEGVVGPQNLAVLYAMGITTVVGGVPTTYETGDMNPAHIVYECLTNRSWGSLKIPASSINDDSFRAAADTFYSEGLGLSLQWLREGPLEDFIREVLDHCGANLTQHPRTGLFELKTLRGDYVTSSLPVFDETNIVEMRMLERSGSSELVNQITYSYVDANNNQDTPVTVQNLAAIQSQQVLVAESYSRPGFSRAEVTRRAAMRDLKVRSTPLLRGELVANRAIWDIVPGGVFVLKWPKRGIVSSVMRVGGVDYGRVTDNKVVVSFTEDVYGFPASTYSQNQYSLAQSDDASVAQLSKVGGYEVPWWMVRAAKGAAEANSLPENEGYVTTVAEPPNGYYTNYSVYTPDETGSQSGYNVNYTGMLFNQVVVLTEDVDFDETSVTVSTELLVETNIGRFAIFQPRQFVDTLDLSPQEMVRISSLDLENGKLVIQRGMWDTTPKPYSLGDRLWILSSAPMGGGISFDKDYDLKVKFRPYTTTSSIPESTIKTSKTKSYTIDLNSRAYRPYPPARIRVNGTTVPKDGVLLTDNFTVDWRHRNRLSYQAIHNEATTATTLEAGSTYSVRIYDDLTEDLLASATGLSGITYSVNLPDETFDRVRLEIEATREGYLSLQKQVRYFSVSKNAILDDNEDGPFLTEDGEILLMESTT
jgi:hypothetical protein